jgi:predicted dehydrogenase
MKVGLIGTGFGTRVHMPAMRADPGIEVVAICSARRDRAEQAAEEWGVPFIASDYRELIARDDVELVDVCTPPDSHAEMTIAALEAGKHVLCEKPLAMNVAEASAMAAAADSARARRPELVDAVHHEMRYFPMRRRLRDLVRRRRRVRPDGHLGGTPRVREPTGDPWFGGERGRRWQLVAGRPSGRGPGRRRGACRVRIGFGCRGAYGACFGPPLPGRGGSG